jgi:hypothetical protein
MSRYNLKKWVIFFSIIFALCGMRMANAWDFSDYSQDYFKAHIEASDDSSNDAEETKYHLQLLAVTAPFSFEPQVVELTGQYYNNYPASPATSPLIAFHSSRASPA